MKLPLPGIPRVYTYSPILSGLKTSLRLQKSSTAFEKIIAECSVDVVHVNTIMPREVLTVARRLDKVSIVHARELISEDVDLADAIGESPSSVASMVLDGADFIIANSTATAECYGGSGRVFVVRNSIAVDRLDIPNTVEQSAVCIALIGSNTGKKASRIFLSYPKFCTSA